MVCVAVCLATGGEWFVLPFVWRLVGSGLCCGLSGDWWGVVCVAVCLATGGEWFVLPFAWRLVGSGLCLPVCPSRIAAAGGAWLAGADGADGGAADATGCLSRGRPRRCVLVDSWFSSRPRTLLSAFTDTYTYSRVAVQQPAVLL